MAVLNKIKRAIRGEVKLTTVAREALRRGRVSLQDRKERATLGRDRDRRSGHSIQSRAQQHSLDPARRGGGADPFMQSDGKDELAVAVDHAETIRMESRANGAIPRSGAAASRIRTLPSPSWLP